MSQKIENTSLIAAINAAYQSARLHVINRGLGAMGLVLSSGGSQHAAISALLYGAVIQQVAAPDKASVDKAASIRQVTEALPEPLNTQVDAILTELLALTGLSTEGQVLQLPRQLSDSSSAAAAALLLVDVASFVNDAQQIGNKAATRYVVTPGSAATFRPTAAVANSAAGIIQLYDGLARQLIKTRRQATAALGRRALALLYSLDELAVEELKTWYPTKIDDTPTSIYILAQADSKTSPAPAKDQPEVEAAPAKAA